MRDIVTELGVEVFKEGRELVNNGDSWRALANKLEISRAQAECLACRVAMLNSNRALSGRVASDIVNACILEGIEEAPYNVADIANIPIEDAIELVYELGAVPENTAAVEEAVDQVLKSTKTIQKLRDKARVTNKLVRSEVRYTNAIEALLEELNDKLKSTVFSEIPKVAHGKVGDNVGLVQISDLHLNEVVDLVDTINYNKFNYDIACRRLKKFHDEIVVNLKSHNVNKVVVVNSGDVLNSDRRLDEILTNAGTRSIALIVAVDILSQFIRDLSSEFSVSYATVLGNESRKFEELTWSNKTFSNNYDFDIHYMLQSLLEDQTDIEFVPIANSYEMLLSVGGMNILVMHGIRAGNDPNNWITKAYTRYAQAGVILDFVILGHVHEALISDRFARSGSLVGSNSYSNNALGKLGKASQNMYIIKDGAIHAMVIDLQDPGILGYTHCRFDELSGQHKSREKAEDRKPYFSITI